MKQIPFWVDDFPRPAGLGGDLPARADYLVVGSGYTGLAAARRLASASKDVVVIDAGEVAGGASSMNGGFHSANDFAPRGEPSSSTSSISRPVNAFARSTGLAMVADEVRYWGRES